MSERTYTHTELMEALNKVSYENERPPADLPREIVALAQAATYATIMNLGMKLGYKDVDFAREAGVPEDRLKLYQEHSDDDSDAAN